MSVTSRQGEALSEVQRIENSPEKCDDAAGVRQVALKAFKSSFEELQDDNPIISRRREPPDGLRSQPAASL